MENIDKLLVIARELGLAQLVGELIQIQRKSMQTNAEIVLPLVGEFSSGKTTLINSLTDSKKLETASEPTTATIYEIHFGCDRCYATVVMPDGAQREIENISDLKNKDLADALVVNIFDTSTLVPPTTVLVDTPGLSSPDPRHKQTLVEFLPQADGILLVMDVNQPITRSLTEFVKTMKLSKRPMFLVITQCYSKSPGEVERQRTYVSENTELPIKHIACVSAKEGNLEELFVLLDNIQKDKKKILEQVNLIRIQNIENLLVAEIDELLKASCSDKDLDEAIRKQEYELNRLNRNIEKLVESTSLDIEDYGRTITRNFEDVIFEKLETLVVSKSDNFDRDAISAINNTSALLLDDFKNNIHEILCRKAREKRGSEDEISLHSLELLDLSSLSMTGLNYDLNLNAIGHQYDSKIATGVKVAAAVVAVAAVASSGGTAGGVVASAATVDNALDVADTVTDVSSIVSNNKTVDRIEKVVSLAGKASDKFTDIDDYNQRAGQQVGCSKGVVESMVGFVTDKCMGKPQRKRAIRLYLEETLMPSFKKEMDRIKQQLISSIRDTLHQEAAELIAQKTASLERMKLEKREKKTAFEQRMRQLRDYRNQILTL